MNLHSLLVCSDDRTLRVLRNVLSELEIEVEHCADESDATRKLAKRRFEAVIIDCKQRSDFSLLHGLRSGQNRKSMAVAIIDPHTDFRAAFEMGANFVVYKPISSEKAKSSFRAARALMRREQRRSVRLDTNIQAYFRFENGEGEQGTISGLSEGGVSVRFASNRKKQGVIGFCFALPDTTTVIEATGMIAWQNSLRRAGIQFATLSDSSRRMVKDWLRVQSGEEHDPPMRGTLTALSLGGCFVGTQSPFPAQTKVELLLRASDCSVRTAANVRFMDPELGMGIAFRNLTVEQRRRLQELIERIALSPDTVAEVLVEPEGLESESTGQSSRDQGTVAASQETQNDPLVELFETGASLSREQFVEALEQHKLALETPSEPVLNSPSRQRREPRIEVSRPVEVRVQDSAQERIEHATSMIDVSHHGARLDKAAPPLKPGDPVHLVSAGVEARFRVIWVGAPGSPQEGQVGLQKMDE